MQSSAAMQIVCLFVCLFVCRLLMIRKWIDQELIAVVRREDQRRSLLSTRDKAIDLPIQAVLSNGGKLIFLAIPQL
jgi:hypothetical protein